MIARRSIRTGWINVFEKPDGIRWLSKFVHPTRRGANLAAFTRHTRQGWKLLYRIYIRPK